MLPHGGSATSQPRCRAVDLLIFVEISSDNAPENIGRCLHRGVAGERDLELAALAQLLPAGKVTVRPVVTSKQIGGGTPRENHAPNFALVCGVGARHVPRSPWKEACRS